MISRWSASEAPAQFQRSFSPPKHFDAAARTDTRALTHGPIPGWTLPEPQTAPSAPNATLDANHYTRRTK